MRKLAGSGALVMASVVMIGYMRKSGACCWYRCVLGAQLDLPTDPHYDASDFELNPAATGVSFGSAATTFFTARSSTTATTSFARASRDSNSMS